ncbi:unnamed protein product [Amoebophrya sp. A120]|nr:unnamed protein product [Amoebophrya sp. A120]|eukprot:GSA120T00019555001.1
MPVKNLVPAPAHSSGGNYKHSSSTSYPCFEAHQQDEHPYSTLLTPQHVDKTHLSKKEKEKQLFAASLKHDHAVFKKQRKEHMSTQQLVAEVREKRRAHEQNGPASIRQPAGTTTGAAAPMLLDDDVEMIMGREDPEFDTHDENLFASATYRATTERTTSTRLEEEHFPAPGTNAFVDSPLADSTAVMLAEIPSPNHGETLLNNKAACSTSCYPLGSKPQRKECSVWPEYEKFKVDVTNVLVDYLNEHETLETSMDCLLRSTCEREKSLLVYEWSDLVLLTAFNLQVNGEAQEERLLDFLTVFLGQMSSGDGVGSKNFCSVTTEQDFDGSDGNTQKKMLSPFDLALEKLLSRWEELKMDFPRFPELLGKILVRLVQDAQVLPVSILNRVPEKFLLEKYLSAGTTSTKNATATARLELENNSGDEIESLETTLIDNLASAKKKIKAILSEYSHPVDRSSGAKKTNESHVVELLVGSDRNLLQFYSDEVVKLTISEFLQKSGLHRTKEDAKECANLLLHLKTATLFPNIKNHFTDEKLGLGLLRAIGLIDEFIIDSGKEKVEKFFFNVIAELVVKIDTGAAAAKNQRRNSDSEQGATEAKRPGSRSATVSKSKSRSNDAGPGSFSLAKLLKKCRILHIPGGGAAQCLLERVELALPQFFVKHYLDLEKECTKLLDLFFYSRETMNSTVLAAQEAQQQQQMIHQVEQFQQETNIINNNNVGSGHQHSILNGRSSTAAAAQNKVAKNIHFENDKETFFAEFQTLLANCEPSSAPPEEIIAIIVKYAIAAEKNHERKASALGEVVLGNVVPPELQHEGSAVGAAGAPSCDRSVWSDKSPMPPAARYNSLYNTTSSSYPNKHGNNNPLSESQQSQSTNWPSFRASDDSIGCGGGCTSTSVEHTDNEGIMLSSSTCSHLDHLDGSDRKNASGKMVQQEQQENLVSTTSVVHGETSTTTTTTTTSTTSRLRLDAHALHGHDVTMDQITEENQIDLDNVSTTHNNSEPCFRTTSFSTNLSKDTTLLSRTGSSTVVCDAAAFGAMVLATCTDLLIFLTTGGTSNYNGSTSTSTACAASVSRRGLVVIPKHCLCPTFTELLLEQSDCSSFSSLNVGSTASKKKDNPAHLHDQAGLLGSSFVGIRKTSSDRPADEIFDRKDKILQIAGNCEHLYAEGQILCWD